MTGLKRTLDSVFMQSCHEYEYIVIDGASTDGSADLKAMYPKVDHFISEPDSGIYAAMNKGIRLAKGEYCLFLNSGDTLYHEDVLAETLRVLNKYKDECDLLSCRLMLPEDDSYLPRDAFNFLCFFPGCIPHQATLIRRDLFNTIGFYREDYRLISDFIFFFNALCLKKVSFKTEDIPFCHYEMNGLSTNKVLVGEEVSRYLAEPEVPLIYRLVMFTRKLRDRLKGSPYA